MTEFLSRSGLKVVLGKIKDGTVKAGAATLADTASVANSVAAANIDGVIPLSKIPKGALEELKIVATEEARLALTSAQVQTGDTVKVTATGKMYFVVDDTKLGTEAAFEVYTAGTATYAEEAGRVSNAITIMTNGSTAATFDGSAAKEVNITPSAIGAATAAQGQKADDAVQTIKIGGVAQTKSGTEYDLPAYPTTLPASDTTDTYSADGTAPVSGKAVASAIANKADKGTTLAGYGITDATIESGTIKLGNNTITPLTAPSTALEVKLTSDYRIGEGSVSANDSVQAAISKLDGTKVDKVSGKGLSTNDYTTDEKTKLAAIATNATSDAALTNDEILAAIAEVYG